MQVSSCLYECEIWHERKLPRHHSFTTRHFMFYLALDQMASVQSVSLDRARVFAFVQSDYLPDRSQNSSCLIDRVKNAARKLGMHSPIERIDLLTNVRVFGYVFNPVSFYFCFGEDGKLLCCICEIGNTFGEKKIFLVEPDGDGQLRSRQKKFFYVSPFTELDHEFRFDIRVPGETLGIEIDTMDEETAVVRAALVGNRVRLTDANLARMLIRYSWASARVIVLIHLHAFLLWLKNVPYHRKEEAMERQRDILNAGITSTSASR